jgi:predicted ATP-dependent protease
MAVRRLTPEQCRLVIAPESLNMRTTEDVPPLTGIASQERALRALEFGLDIRQPRFHVVAVGDAGGGRTFSARSVAQRIASTRPTPDDVLLLPNPTKPSQPTVLALPAGDGRPFADAMGELHEALLEVLRHVPEGERFKHARSRLERRARERESELESALQEVGESLGLDLVREEDEVKVTAKEGEEPSSEALLAIGNAVEEFEEQLVEIQEEVERELRAELKRLMIEAVRARFAPMVERYGARSDIHAFLTEVEKVVGREIRAIIDDTHPEDAPTLARGTVVPTLLTEHEPGSGAPVVEVAYPTLTALFGRAHVPPDSSFPPEPGFAVAGALHRANGGFLILPAATLLKNVAVYEQLKACLLAGKFIVPEHDPTYFRGTVEELLLPPITLDIKVILVASPSLYQELHELDAEFSQLFKVQARFEHQITFAQAMVTYPAFLAGFLRDRGLPPMTAAAVAQLLAYGCRLNESQSKVSAQIGLVAEVASEAAYTARRAGLDIIDAPLVKAALEAAHWRGRYFQDEIHRLLSDGTIRIDVEGRRVGQVNAVSVMSDGPLSFGKPCRVTAVTYPGIEGPINIAREVEMSGPIHSKGVLILKGFLAARFAQKRPLLFGASLVFEQTYEAIDGDSASTTELYALLSSLSEVPIQQRYAVTGSVDQHGAVQPVGAINEKIESFFDVCSAKGPLSGEQGVLIPSRNSEGLMLREDVVEAVRQGTFHIFAVDTVDEGIELLTGVPAGTPDSHGHYPPNSIYGRVETRLKSFRHVLRGYR